MKSLILFAIIFSSIFIFSTSIADKPCISRKYNHSSNVCVCNSTYCDEISKIQILEKDSYVIYSSNLVGLRFQKENGIFTKNKLDKDGNDVVLKINRSQQYQKISGFGGSFTDAAGINILSLSENAQRNIIKSYFGENGLEYNLARVPIGGCDFSTHPYAYNMQPEDDLELSNFSLTMEDYTYKIPFILEASQIATDDILLMGTAWSPPPWMKTNNDFGGESRLIPKYYQTWANYHLRFLEEYDKNGINFWAISTGNEPSNGVLPVMGFNSLGWMPEDQSLWLVNHFGPTLKNSRFGNISILALDDQRISLPWWIQRMAKTEGAMDYLSGIAVHWYWNDFVTAGPIETLHEQFPDKFFLATEACIGDKPWQLEKVELGSWERGEKYIEDILEDLNHWHVGWIDWNLVLDRIGGPNWFDNFVDSPIIAMPEEDEFLKQPLFYAMGHFSKFIPRNSVRVSVDINVKNVDNVAFLRPDGGMTVVLHNPSNEVKHVIIEEEGKGFIEIDITAKSINSIVYW